MRRRDFLKALGVAAVGTVCGGRSLLAGLEPGRRPNILVCMADDWGWPFAPAYGDSVIKTPNFDRVAKDGVVFTQAYCSAPTCTASRAALLTGQDFYRLGPGANLNGPLGAGFPVYPDLLEQAGYAVGFTGKGWGPGSVEGTGRTRNPAGPSCRNFGAFVKDLPAEQPFCFWMGSNLPHRPFTTGPEGSRDVDPSRVAVPAFLPDHPEVRRDLSDYYAAVQRFDKAVGACLKALEASGRADNTLIVVTGDNGMPFPRCKANLYNYGVHQPLAVCWKGRIAGARRVDDFTGLPDLAPTFLEAAGLPVPAAMTGRSLMPLLLSGKSGQVEPARDYVVVGREKHMGRFPARAIRTRDHAYIRNVQADFPEVDTDQGPAKAYVLGNKADEKVKPYFERSFGARPPEELYDLARDPFEMNNLAGTPEHAAVQKGLADRLTAYLARTRDPRVRGEEAVFGDVARPGGGGE